MTHWRSGTSIKQKATHLPASCSMSTGRNTSCHQNSKHTGIARTKVFITPVRQLVREVCAGESFHPPFDEWFYRTVKAPPRCFHQVGKGAATTVYSRIQSGGLWSQHSWSSFSTHEKLEIISLSSNFKEKCILLYEYFRTYVELNALAPVKMRLKLTG